MSEIIGLSNQGTGTLKVHRWKRAMLNGRPYGFENVCASMHTPGVHTTTEGVLCKRCFPQGRKTPAFLDAAK